MITQDGSLAGSERPGDARAFAGVGQLEDRGGRGVRREAMRRYGVPRVIVTDRLRSYGAALCAFGSVDRHSTGRWLNNRAENSHQPFRRRERAMQRFRQSRTLQTFAAVHASVCNHFNLERHLYSRANIKLRRAAALTEWRQVCAA